jgi:hypothetical protein
MIEAMDPAPNDSPWDRVIPPTRHRFDIPIDRDDPCPAG